MRSARPPTLGAMGPTAYAHPCPQTLRRRAGVHHDDGLLSRALATACHAMRLRLRLSLHGVAIDSSRIINYTRLRSRLRASVADDTVYAHYNLHPSTVLARSLEAGDPSEWYSFLATA